MSDARIAASYAKSFARNGHMVIVRRINGLAPHTRTVSARVLAIVTGYVPDTVETAKTGYREGEPGAIGQGDRMVMVLESDLRRARFPLPVQKNDVIVLGDGNGGRLNIVSVDAEKRHMAGAIELRAAGVA